MNSEVGNPAHLLFKREDNDMEQTELTPIALYDEAEAQRIVKLIEEVDDLPSGATGSLWVSVGRTSQGILQDKVYGRTLFVGVVPFYDEEKTICVFRRFEPDHGGKPTQDVFKPGAWIQQLEALPDKLRQQEAERQQRQQEEAQRKLEDAFAPIDDAVFFAAPSTESAKPVAAKPEPLPAKKLLYLKVSNDLEKAEAELNTELAKGYWIESVVAFPTYNNEACPDFALFVLKLADY